MLDMKRREFIAVLGAGGLLLAVKVRRGRAQQPAMPVIGFLGSSSAQVSVKDLEAFRKGLSETFRSGANHAAVKEHVECSRLEVTLGQRAGSIVLPRRRDRSASLRRTEPRH
jgi:hypothetical protein